MDLKANMLSLEEEMTNIEVDSFQEEVGNARDNYLTLDNEYLTLERNIPYPDINQYTTAIDYEDQLDLQHKKRRNMQYIDKIKIIKDYVDDGSLYCGHCKVGNNDVYLMDHSWHQTKHIQRKDGSELFLLNVNDKLYQRFVDIWRFPSDYQDVVLSRNIVLKNRNVKEVDVVFESANSAFSEITDAYLRKALLRNKGKSSTQSIIQTIQKKQDYIRLYDKNRSFIVQGCAGSGKTMVLLHRLRYLIYNNEINSNDYVLLIPSIGFRTFIDDLSTKFNIRKSNILSYQEYYSQLMNKEILEGDIKDELVFDNEYLSNVYSKDFMKNCYRKFFEHIIEQGETIISYCDECLSNRSELEYEEIINYINTMDKDFYNQVNKSLLKVSSQTKLKEASNLCDVITALSRLKMQNNDYLSCLKSYEELTNISLDLGDAIENNENLKTLQNQIDKETLSRKKASRFTKASHERKLKQLQKKYNVQKEKLIKSLSENSEYKRKEKILSLCNGVNKVIKYDLLKAITEIERLYTEYVENKNYYEKILDDYDNYFRELYINSIVLLNEFIEVTSSISDYESEYVEHLVPIDKKIGKIILKGQELVESYLNDKLYTEKQLSKKTRLFTKRTNVQLNSYLNNNVMFNIIKKEMVQLHKVKLSKYYKHYWFLQLYSKYLVGNISNEKFKYIFIDEAQDLSPNELDLIYKINQISGRNDVINPIMNLFGDINQTITNHGVNNWNTINLGFDIFTLDENFRNTNQIIEYCNKYLPFEMKKIGVDMEDVSVYSDFKEAIRRNRNLNNNPIIVVKDEFVKQDFGAHINAIGWNKNYSIFTVKESKGLEFKETFVIDCEMTDNEKYIAYTRALASLNVIHDIPLNEYHKSLIIFGEDNEEELLE